MVGVDMGTFRGVTPQAAGAGHEKARPLARGTGLSLD